MDPVVGQYRQQCRRQFIGQPLLEQRARLLAYTHELGFEHYVVGVHCALGEDLHNTSIDSLQDGSLEFSKRYAGTRPIPTIRVAQETATIFIFPVGPIVYDDEDSLFFKASRQAGLTHALMTSTLQRRGPILRLVLGRAEGEITGKEVQEKIFHIRALIATLKESLQPLLLKNLPPLLSVTLTPNEKKVCQGFAAGLNNDKVAEKMHLTSHSITKYRQRIKKKFEAEEFLEAVVQADRLGLLDSVFS